MILINLNKKGYNEVQTVKLKSGIQNIYRLFKPFKK